jgi:putative RNA 2'-phosphotransferase
MRRALQRLSMTNQDLIERITRSLAYMLRHQPEEFDLRVDQYGWADLGEVVHALTEKLGEPIEAADVQAAVDSGDRRRYEVREDKVRALYGHSIPIEPGEPSEPPEAVYVGVSRPDAERARRHGLRSGRRRFLHLAASEEDAVEMGRRLGREYAVVTVRAREASAAGIHFYDRYSLWLSDPVPTEFLDVGEVRTDGFELERRPQAPRDDRRPHRHERHERGGDRGGERREQRPAAAQAAKVHASGEYDSGRDSGRDADAPREDVGAADERGGDSRRRRRGRRGGRGRREGGEGGGEQGEMRDQPREASRDQSWGDEGPSDARRDEPRRDDRGPRDDYRRDEPRRDEPRRDEPRRDDRGPRDEYRRDEPRRDEPRRDDRGPRDDYRRDEPRRDRPRDDRGPRDDYRREEPRRDEPRRDEPRRDRPARAERSWGDEPRRDEPRRDRRDERPARDDGGGFGMGLDEERSAPPPARPMAPARPVPPPAAAPARPAPRPAATESSDDFGLGID